MSAVKDKKFLELKQLYLEGQEKLDRQEEELKELRRAVNFLSGILFEMMEHDELEIFPDGSPKFPEEDRRPQPN